MSNEDTHVDIAGLSKAAVLAVLYNSSAPCRMGFLQSGFGPEAMTVEQAEQYVGVGTSPDPGSSHNGGGDRIYFDYLHGRPMRLDLSADDKFDPWGFDCDNGGNGTAQRIINELRATGEVNSDDANQARVDKTMLNAHEAMDIANTPSIIDRSREIVVFNLGGSDIGNVLQKAVDHEVDRVGND